MANISSLPVEVLHIIFSYLDRLRRRSSSAALIYGSTEWDRSIFEAMRVCRLWRDVVFNVYFGSDCSKWSRFERRENIARVKYVDSLPERLQQSKRLKHGDHGPDCPDCPNCSRRIRAARAALREPRGRQTSPKGSKSVLQNKRNKKPVEVQATNLVKKNESRSKSKTATKKRRLSGRTWKAATIRKLMKKWVRSIKPNST